MDGRVAKGAKFAKIEPDVIGNGIIRLLSVRQQCLAQIIKGELSPLAISSGGGRS